MLTKSICCNNTISSKCPCGYKTIKSRANEQTIMRCGNAARRNSTATTISTLSSGIIATTSSTASRRSSLRPFANQQQQQTNFVKIKPKQQQTQRQHKNGSGHAPVYGNNFSRRNSAATTISSLSTTATTSSASSGLSGFTATTNADDTSSLTDHRPQSWSLARQHQLLRDHENKIKNKQLAVIKRPLNDYTEQRSNYEQMIKQREIQQAMEALQLEQQRSWSPATLSSSSSLASEPVAMNCHLNSRPNSRHPGGSMTTAPAKTRTRTIATTGCLDDYTINNIKVNPVMMFAPSTNCSSDIGINAEFLALRDFRFNNPKECFSENRQHELQQNFLRTATTMDNRQHGNNMNSMMNSNQPSFEMDWCNRVKYLKNHENDSKQRASSASPSSLSSSSTAATTSSTSSSTMPYVMRQRLLREQLLKESPNRRATHLGLQQMALNKSIALNYQPKY